MIYTELLEEINKLSSQIRKMIEMTRSKRPKKVFNMIVRCEEDDYNRDLDTIFGSYSRYICQATTEYLPSIMKKAEEHYQADLKARKEELENLSLQLIKRHE